MSVTIRGIEPNVISNVKTKREREDVYASFNWLNKMNKLYN